MGTVTIVDKESVQTKTRQAAAVPFSLAEIKQIMGSDAALYSDEQLLTLSQDLLTPASLLGDLALVTLRKDPIETYDENSR